MNASITEDPQVMVSGLTPAEWSELRLLWPEAAAERLPLPMPQAPWKRLVDVALSGAALVGLSPLLALLALAVKAESPGPVLYSQERVGQGGYLFHIYKYRSMVPDAEAGGPRWAVVGEDPRVTRVGRFLRRTHLDELPQLWNVLRGDMSLVGPRPERPCFVEELQRWIPQYYQRLQVKPGITGLAQVHYQYDASLSDVRRKLRFDRLYLHRMNLLLDLRILWQTLTVVMCGKGQ